MTVEASARARRFSASRLAASRVPGFLGQPVPTSPELGRPRLPGGERRTVDRRVGFIPSFGRPLLALGGGDAGAFEVGSQALGLGVVPGAFADGGLMLPGGEALGLLGTATDAGSTAFLRSGAVQGVGRLLRRGGQPHRDAARARGVRLRGLELAGQPDRLGPSLEDRFAGAERDAELGDDRTAVTGDHHPARR